MAAYLLFQLIGPLQAWGGIAVGEMRPSYAAPSKSAILGLIAAALGIRREEEERHRELDAGYGFAVRIDVPGKPMFDYHTVQMPKARKGREFQTRRQELTSLAPNESPATLLSTREYIQDAAFTACIWSCAQPAPYSLTDIAHAIKHPVFPLYLGRKSCPPALPLSPQEIHAPTLAQAFTEYTLDQGVTEKLVSRYAKPGNLRIVYESTTETGFAQDGTGHVHQVTRRDAVMSRVHRQFRDRVEYETHVASAHRE